MTNNLSKMEKMGIYIKKVRENRVKISQEKLADALGVTRQTISKWERGVNAPDIMILKEICENLNITIYELLDEEDKPRDYEPKDVTDFTFKNIKFYISKAKQKIIKVIVLIIVSLIILFGSILYLFDYYKWNEYEVSGNDVYYNLKGYIIGNRDESIYNINYISYVGEDINTGEEPLVKELELSLFLDDKLVYSYGIRNDNVLPIHYCLKNIPITYNTKGKDIFDSKSELALEIRYIDENDSENVRMIDIKTL